MTKSLIIRALIIYFVSSFLRKPAPVADNATGDPAGTPANPAATNYFSNGTLFDLHGMYPKDVVRLVELNGKRYLFHFSIYFGE